jgi:putative DNA primase/helicase
MTAKWNPDEYERAVLEDVARVSAKPKTEREARKDSGKPGDQTRVLPSPRQPRAVARVFVAEMATHASGALILRHWRGGWWSWRTSHWQEAEPRLVRELLYRYTENAFYIDDKGLPGAWQPNRYKIDDVLDSLASLCLLPGHVDQPSWLDDRTTGTIVACSNGLLDVETRVLLPHDPHYFNVVSVPFPFDPTAPEPSRWHKFLGELWPNETVPIDVLGEWFGYVISGRVDLHKILLMVGPTRGGKGAIARVLAALVGRQNTAGPTLNSLGGDFGLAPLIGKSLAVISDARFAGRDSSIVVERLLSISGEDKLTINIKFKEQWNGQLQCRLHVLSNELPKLGDASTAIVGRFVLLQTTRSWLGQEDHGLEPALHAELPGILNFALDGLARLTRNDRFTHLPSAEEAIIAMRDLASPVAAFLRERCELGPDKEIATDDLYADYRMWAENAGTIKQSKHMPVWHCEGIARARTAMARRHSET